MPDDRVAFESEIHATGQTISLKDLEEFEATSATKKHTAFDIV